MGIFNFLGLIKKSKDKKDKILKSVILFDLSNINRSFLKEKKEYPDVLKIRAFIQKRNGGKHIKSIIFTSYDPDNRKQLNYLGGLEASCGFEVVKKPIVKVRERAEWGDMDFEIANFIKENVRNYDEIIIVTGDGDLVEPLKEFKRWGKGRVVKAYGVTRKSFNKALHAVSSYPVTFLEDYWDYIRSNRKSGKRSFGHLRLIPKEAKNGSH